MPGLAFQGRVHELLAPFFLEHRLPVQRLDAVVHHYGATAPAREAAKPGYYLALARQEAQSHPDRYQAQFNLVNTALAAGDWPQLQAAAEACQRLRPGFAEPLVLLGLGIAHQHLGDPARALVCLQALLQVQPNHGLALVRSALSLVLLGQATQAQATLEHAITVLPGYALPWLNLGEIQAQLGEVPTARATFLRGLAALPGEISLLQALVRLDLQSHQIELAIQDARAALAAQPQGGGGLWHRLLATDLLRQDRRTEARDLLSRGLELFPADPDLARLLRTFNE